MAFDYSDRQTRSGFPVSIGTGIALEALLDPVQEVYKDRVQPERVDLQRYQALWVNARTLYRNFMGSFEPAIQNNISALSVLTGMDDEMNQIRILMSNLGLDVRFFACDYQLSPKINPLIKLRMATTPKQLHQLKIEQDVIKKLIQSKLIEQDGSEMKTAPLKVLVMTHFAYDLLQHRKMARLELLESHTGRVKNRFHFYTKFYDGDNLAMIPFCRQFLMIFGDRSLYSPVKGSIRDKIKKIAINRRWNQTTTIEQALRDLLDLRDPFLLEVIKSL